MTKKAQVAVEEDEVGESVDSPSVFNGHHEEEELDRISKLHDELLVEVVSRLPLKEAIRTSFLSSRWRDVWKSANLVLDLNNEDFMAETMAERRRLFRDMVIGAVKLLQPHPNIGLKKLRLAGSFPECDFVQDIHHWLELGVSKRAEFLHVEITFLIGWDGACPEKSGQIEPPATLSEMTSLRSLRLSCVDLTNEILENIISNCSVLEELSLARSRCLTELKVVGSSQSPLSLKHLEVVDCSVEVVEVDHAPRLVRVIYSDWYRVRYLRMANCPCLVEMDLGCVLWLFCNPRLRSLSGCAAQLESLSMEVSNMEKIPFPKLGELTLLERLNVKVSDSRHSILKLMIPLINLCPVLHTLQMSFLEPYKRRRLPLLREEFVKTRRESIKVLEIFKFNGYDMDLEFIGYAMEYFVGLERIVIHLDYCTTTTAGAQDEWKIERLREAEEAASNLKAQAPPSIEFTVE